MSIREAFFTACEDAKPAESIFVSLYASHPYYGGPEEGGWWGSDTELIAYRECKTEEEAEATVEKVKALAEDLSKQATRAWGEQCQRELDWCDARGLDADYLPETDGDTSYHVCQEETPGEGASRGCRHYE